MDVKDRVTGTIKGIIGKAGRLLSHPLALIGIGGGIAGATGAGLKAVMEEQDIVSSFEVMLEIAGRQSNMQELIAFAGMTPFTRRRFPAFQPAELLTGGALSTDRLADGWGYCRRTIQPLKKWPCGLGGLRRSAKDGQ